MTAPPKTDRPSRRCAEDRDNRVVNAEHVCTPPRGRSATLPGAQWTRTAKAEKPRDRRPTTRAVAGADQLAAQPDGHDTQAQPDAAGPLTGSEMDEIGW